jgi:hypothetical protein
MENSSTEAMQTSEKRLGIQVPSCHVPLMM